ncbi:MAG: hypothetical protein GY841_16975 [FCB group bacterium]|nr:hypothetical protein [FCB group bacterium]
MLKFFTLIMAVILVGSAVPTAVAQVGDLPEVEMVADNYEYMISLFADDYPDRRRALRACSTIAEQSESLKVFWEEQGDAILYYLSYYAGINWVEQKFDIQIVKYYPDFACHNPLTIPLTGKKNGVRIEAVPQGLSHYLTLFQQLSRRLLEQASLPGGSPYYISGHPLMLKTPRRFDNLANLLALRTLSDFADVDSILTIFRSSHWKKREAGQEILFDYFWKQWQLSPDSTLASLIAAEPYGSRLVALTRRPVQPRPRRSGWGNHQLQPPPGGQIGMSVIKDRSGFFRVVEVDTLKLAYLSGLREDDLIRSIEGTAPRNIKQLFSLILEYLQQGAHIDIVRNDERDAVILYPWDDS